MVKAKLDKLKMIEMIFIFSGSLALLWFSIVKAYLEFPRETFYVFLGGLIVTAVMVMYLLKKELTTYWSEI